MGDKRKASRMKYITLIAILLLSGCVQIIVEPGRVKYNSFLKDITYKDLESISNKIKADITTMPVPHVKVKTGN